LIYGSVDLKVNWLASLLICMLLASGLIKL